MARLGCDLAANAPIKNAGQGRVITNQRINETTARINPGTTTGGGFRPDQ